MDTTATPRCPHFGQCGGCAFQDVPYPGQLSAKQASLKEWLGSEVEVVPSPKPYGYRNRMDFVCAFGRIGLRRRGRHDEVVEIDRCHLLPERASDFFQTLKALVRSNGIPDFNYMIHRGYLRYITIRAAENTPDLLVNFVTASDDERILSVLEEAAKTAVSVNWIVQGGLADLNYGPIKQCLGRPYFTEKAGERTFHAGPNTFVQNNASLAPTLLDFVRGHVAGRTLDLYCGMGAITLSVADRAESVLGVELEGESIGFAGENLALNGVKNASFLASDTKKWLIEHEKEGGFDTIIIDPPRSGLGGKVARKILRMAPKRIIYVSCNPKMLAEDLKTFESAYRVTALKGFDMFPQTPHVEAVGVMERNL